MSSDENFRAANDPAPQFATRSELTRLAEELDDLVGQVEKGGRERREIDQELAARVHEIRVQFEKLMSSDR